MMSVRLFPAAFERIPFWFLQPLRTNVLGQSLCKCNEFPLVFQFSALYPEMVEDVVLLDTYGFLPTEVVTINGAC